MALKPIALKKDKIRKIAMYGKGGIGKSTVSANVSAALSFMGEKVIQVGCDPKRDSIATLCGGIQPTILDEVSKNGGRVTKEVVDNVLQIGFNGVLGIESGGPKPGTGCAGRGVMMALQILEEYNILEEHKITFALFDVLGDVVCGGFAQPMRGGYAKEVYIVTCGEILTLLQMNNICMAIRKLHDDGVETAIAGLINNMRGIRNEEKIVEEIAEIMGLPVIHHIPRSRTVQEAELSAKTVIEAFPDSDQAKEYRTLAKKILYNDKVYIPNPIDLSIIKPVVLKHAGKQGKRYKGGNYLATKAQRLKSSSLLGSGSDS